MQPLAPPTHLSTTRSRPRDGTREREEKITTPPSTFTPLHPHPTRPRLFRPIDHPHRKSTQPMPFRHWKIVSAAAAAATATIAMSSPSLLSLLATLGLGYSIAIALGFLVLLASLLLASYFCFRRGGGAGGGHFSGAITPASTSSHLSITVPRVLFVAEGSESPDAYSSAAAAASSPVGLDPAAIASYPKVPFCRAAAAGAGADAMCSICLCEYRDGETLRVMPECRHMFHVVCLDAWLRRSASCPVCRSSPIPTPVATPLATPLSELVPLSQYTADRRRSR